MRVPAIRPVIAVAAALALVAACGSDDPENPETTTGAPTAGPAADGALADVSVDLDEETGPAFLWDGEPFAEGDLPFAVTSTEVTELAPGEGDAAGEEHLVDARYSLLNGSTGEVALSTYETGETVSFDLADPGLLPGIRTALDGATPGSERLAAITSEELFAQGAPELMIEPGDTVLIFFEILDVTIPLEQAEGTEVAPVEGLPEVSFEMPGPAQITIPEGADAPEEMVVQLLIEGEGEPTQAGQAVSVHYTGVSWDSGEMFDNSWERGTPFTVSPLGQAPVIDGWNEGLQGLPVGSRVMLVLPPEQAYGEQGHELSGQTLVFVVDILHAG